MALEEYRSDAHRKRPFVAALKNKDGDFIAVADVTTTLIDLLNRLDAWATDMEVWGQRVRLDIIRLEAATGSARNDPGDPPPRPWP